MENALFFAGLFAATLIICALLYYAGVLTFSSKSALVFVMNGNFNFKNKHIAFRGCNGTVRRVIRFKSETPVRVEMKTELNGGSVTAHLRDRAGECAIEISDAAPESAVLTPRKCRAYYLTLSFKGASGELWFCIKEVSGGENEPNDAALVGNAKE